MFRVQVDEEDMFHLKKDCKQNDSTANSLDENDGQVSRRGHRSRDGTKVVVSGIGKICGLPLPHAGMELYGVLPCEELQSALRLVAQLTHVIARCFNIRLPHPIVIVPPSSQQQQPQSTSSTSSSVNNNDGDIADLANTSFNNTDGTCVSASNGAGNHSITASLTSLSSIWSGGGIAESRTAVTGTSAPRSQSNHQQQPLTVLSMDPKQVEARIRHATVAIIAEDQSRTTFYTLSTMVPTSTDVTIDATIAEHSESSDSVRKSHTKPNTISEIGRTSQQQQQKVNEELAIAILLQNDILMLCMSVGVPIDQLYPGEALLLNLYALQLYCSENV
jgi:hypothetical protein